MQNCKQSGVIIPTRCLPLEVSFQSNKAANSNPGTVAGGLIAAMQMLAQDEILLEYVTSAKLLGKYNSIIFLGCVEPNNYNSLALHLACGFTLNLNPVVYEKGESPSEVLSLNLEKPFK